MKLNIEKQLNNRDNTEQASMLYFHYAPLVKQKECCSGEIKKSGEFQKTATITVK